MKNEELAAASQQRKREEVTTWSVMRVLLWATFLVLHSSFFISCSESDDTADEFANWQARNDTYFEQQYQASAVRYASWSLPQSRSVDDLAHTDCIVVNVLESGSETQSPYYTDTVLVHYSGRLMPSDSYPEGYEFDRSWLSSFDPAVDVPTKFALNGSLVDGFSTALQHMHRGDRWRVVIPYQLGYGEQSTSSGAVPAYSTLIFDIRLVDFWHRK